MTQVVSLKVSNLREIGYPHLEAWMNDVRNVYTGRHGRIFIYEGSEKRAFSYKASKWQNPYKLKDYNLTESLQRYTLHLFNSGLIHDIDELKGKNLGCLCDKKYGKDGMPLCHAQILKYLADNEYEFVEKLLGRKMDSLLPQRRSDKIYLVPSIFTGRNKEGDFSWMIEQPEYKDALFIFNDNREEFVKQSSKRGGGNAVIRPYQKVQPPRSTGISTGTYKSGGYASLNDGDAKEIIDKGIAKLKRMLMTGLYNRVFYSADKSGKLGTGIFEVGEDVKTYIVAEMKKVVV